MKVKKKYEHHLIEKRNQNALDVWLTIVALEEILSSGESISHQDAAVESRHGIPNRITIKRNQTELLTNGSTIAVYVCVWKSVVFFHLSGTKAALSETLSHIFVEYLYFICILGAWNGNKSGKRGFLYTFLGENICFCTRQAWNCGTRWLLAYTKSFSMGSVYVSGFFPIRLFTR